ncbi:MAG: flagellar basal body-associated FliL family protein [Fimbriimonadaceae bacterium]|nr:flagellar basal body-associated FliL family protein [Fimbriimonadaceae bacterium]
MSDAKEVKEGTDAAPKKKSKLPIILVLVLVIAGGGFFMMKGKGPKKKEEIKLGKEIIQTTEILTNLKSQGSYARIVLGLHLKEGAKKEEVEAMMPAIRDAVQLIISSQTSADLFSEVNRPMLRARIAQAINEILEANAPHKEGEEAAGDAKDGKDEKAPKEGEAKPTEDSHAKKPDDAHAKKGPPVLSELPNGWDSKEGPVLKVYFNDLATQ